MLTGLKRNDQELKMYIVACYIYDSFIHSYVAVYLYHHGWHLNDINGPQISLFISYSSPMKLAKVCLNIGKHCVAMYI